MPCAVCFPVSGTEERVMREDLLNELTAEYEAQRARNDREENARRDKIRRDFPDIEKRLLEREGLVFGTIRNILDGNAGAENLTEKMQALNDEIEQMLRENGLPADYLSPVYKCAKCRDTGYTGDPVREPCECLKRAYQQKLRDLIGLGKNAEETFETYNAQIIPEVPVGDSEITQRDLSKIARTCCEKWADSYPEVQSRDMLLTGPSGLGKSFLMHAMAARLIERGINVLMISAYSFLQMARKSHFETEDGVRELMDVPVLMVDDLGSEPLMQNITVEQLFHLINERQRRGLSTVISTNLTLPELKDRYTERIVSRLNDPKNCQIIVLEGRDLRKVER